MKQDLERLCQAFQAVDTRFNHLITKLQQDNSNSNNNSKSEETSGVHSGCGENTNREEGGVDTFIYDDIGQDESLVCRIYYYFIFPSP